MDITLFLLVVGYVSGLDPLADDDNYQGPPEYCEAETFVARCHDDEVILMKHARYGRMRAGRCVIRNYGYLGCSADVMPHLDWKCSGKRECSLRIPDKALDVVNPCPKDLKTYLEVEYQCIKVVEPPCHACSQSNHSAVVSGQTGHLASTVVTDSGCGTGLCPWVIQDVEGRRINLTLFDFSVPEGQEVMYGADDCNRLALVREPGGNHDDRVELCSGMGRETHVYTSHTSVIEVVVDPSFMSDDVIEQRRFIIKYEAFGCPDLTPPSNAWVEREGDVLVVGCTATETTYHLACADNRWTGTVGACPQTVSTEETADILPAQAHPMGIMVAIAIGIALIIGSLVLTIGLVYVRRRGVRRPPSSPYNIPAQHYSPPDPRMVFMSKMANGTYCSQECQKACYQAILTAKPRPNDYDYAMEMRPLPEAPDLAPIESANCGPSYSRQVSYSPGVAGVHCNPAFQRVVPSSEPIYRHSTSLNGQPRCCRHYFELEPDQVDIVSLDASEQRTLPLITRDQNGRVTTEERQNKTNRGKEFTRQRSYNGGSLLTTFGAPTPHSPDGTTTELLESENSNKFSWP